MQASKLLPHGVGTVRKAFVDLSLEIHRGERIALFSGNAYESRTLLECLSGIETPDQGSVLHHGSVSWPLGTNQAFDKKLSGYMNARFAAEIYSQSGRIDEDLKLIQELAGVDDRTFHEPLAAWRSAMRKSLELAVSLAFEFDATLVGKISSWNHRVRHPHAVRIRQVFEQRIEGRTLLVAAPGQHELALDYCDEGLVIFEGRLAYRGDVEVCMEMVKEEAQRLRAERRQRVNARIARLLADDSGALDDFDSDEFEEDDLEMDEPAADQSDQRAVPAGSMLPS
ncbi:MAG: hypothetical protein WBN89_05490 [Prochlorococcaceae cyanobacterium]